MWELWIQVLPVAGLLALGFTVGRWREARHLRNLTQREQTFADMLVTNLRAVAAPETARDSAFVCGDAVIATDFFKGFVASLRNIVGGEVVAYTTLLQRARREATLRMLEQARQLGATEVWNVRYETSNILSGSRKSPAVSVEIIASGTAVIRR